MFVDLPFILGETRDDGRAEEKVQEGFAGRGWTSLELAVRRFNKDLLARLLVRHSYCQ